MSGSYAPTSWVDGVTKLGPTNLNKLEDGARDAYTQAHQIFNVKDVAYGAKGDGATDDTTAIQAAITAAAAATDGGMVYFPAGDYRVSSTLTITANGVYLRGAGSDATRIVTTVATGDVFQFGNGTAIFDVGLSGVIISTTAASRTSGSAININNASRAHFVDVSLTKQFTGYSIQAGASIFIESSAWWDFTASTGVGLDITGGNDIYVSRIVGTTSGTQPAAAIIVSACGGSLVVSDCDFVSWGIGLQVNPAGSQIVNWLWFTNVAWDTNSGIGVNIAPGTGGTVRSLYFVNCWTASGSSDGVHIDQGAGTVDDVSFVSHRSFNNTGHGFALITGTNLAIESSAISGNSQGSAGTNQGIYISHPTHIIINGNRIRPMNGYANTQANGIFLDAAASDYCLITSNDTQGNDLASITNDSTGLHNTVTNNIT